MEGNRAALAYLQDEAGMTRTGYHRGSGAESRAELGRWEHARDWVIGSFRQHTSRSGDPQLHVHNLVLNKVETERDGKWRKLDSKALYRYQGAAAAIAAAVMEAALTRDFGLAWVPRADGHGREIAGISQELMDAFSSRRRHHRLPGRSPTERERENGRRPDAWQMYRIKQDIALRTRQPKPEAHWTWAKLRDGRPPPGTRTWGSWRRSRARSRGGRQRERDREQQTGRCSRRAAVLRVAQASAGVRAAARRAPGRGVGADRAVRQLRHPARHRYAPGGCGAAAARLGGAAARDAQAQGDIRRDIAPAQARPPAPGG